MERRLGHHLGALSPPAAPSPAAAATGVGLGARRPPAALAAPCPAAAADGPHVLVVGATGVVGRAAVEEFESLGGYTITMVSRRPPAYPTQHARHLPLDLTDRAACEAALGSELGASVTHLIYTAIAGVDIADPEAIEMNTAMLRNTLEPLESAPGSRLQHISLMQGRKAYAGNEPAELLWPLKERHPRHDTEPNWYFTQEDLLQELQAARSDTSWRWTVWRPPTVLGFVPGAPLSMVAAVGVCACSLCVL